MNDRLWTLGTWLFAGATIGFILGLVVLVVIDNWLRRRRR